MKKFSKGIMIMLIYIMVFSLLPKVTITAQAKEKQSRKIEYGYIWESSQYEDNFILRYWGRGSSYVINNGDGLSNQGGELSGYFNNKHKRYKTDHVSIYDLAKHERTLLYDKLQALEDKIKEEQHLGKEDRVDVYLLNVTDTGELIFEYSIEKKSDLDTQEGIIYKNKMIETEPDLRDVTVIDEVVFYYENEKINYIDLKSGKKNEYKLKMGDHSISEFSTIKDYIVIESRNDKENQIKTLKFNNGNIMEVETVKSRNSLEFDKDAYIWEKEGNKLYRYESGGKKLKRVLDDEYLSFFVYDENRIALGDYYKVKSKFIYPDFHSEGWENLNGVWYYYENGIIQTGWKYINGKYFYLNNNGQMQTGWLNLNGRWYYLNNSGEMQTGWLNLNGKWYYLNNSGEMQTGWLNLNGKWYYLNNGGEMQTSWLNLNGRWYYLNNSGEMQTGWLNLNGKWYYLNDGGLMQTGWLNLNGKWYYLNNGGEMQKGWQWIDDAYYYLGASGEMAKGWNYIDNNWYYLYNSGKMATNVEIDGWKIGYSGIAVKIA
ncbi:MAG: hypothetical protein ACRC28_16845 [Clostridium sp.]|uniref:hypothetical protein n=1 Tax=Clostridium sp. TaxID=1506 RepID=UPI003F36A921